MTCPWNLVLGAGVWGAGFPNHRLEAATLVVHIRLVLQITHGAMAMPPRICAKASRALRTTEIVRMSPSPRVIMYISPSRLVVVVCLRERVGERNGCLQLQDIVTCLGGRLFWRTRTGCERKNVFCLGQSHILAGFSGALW